MNILKEDTIEFVQLTNYDPDFAKEITDGINKDFPDVAIVTKGCCFVRKDYYESRKRKKEY